MPCASSFGDQGSSERQRGGAEDRQQIVGHPGRGNAFHHAVDLEARVTSLELGDARDRPGLRPDVEDRARRRVGARHRPRVGLDDDDAGSLRIRERSPEHGVHHTEDRGVQADAKPEGQDDDHPIARGSPEHTGAAPGVPGGCLETGSEAHVPHALLDLLDSFDLNEGRALCLPWCEALSFE
jgi:hypothetical protein